MNIKDKRKAFFVNLRKKSYFNFFKQNRRQLRQKCHIQAINENHFAHLTSLKGTHAC